MSEQLQILLLAYYFPPDSSSGSLRPLFLANHLREMGANVTILSAMVEDYLHEQPRIPNFFQEYEVILESYERESDDRESLCWQ